jgi:hypothetical protein
MVSVARVEARPYVWGATACLSDVHLLTGAAINHATTLKAATTCLSLQRRWM